MSRTAIIGAMLLVALPYNVSAQQLLKQLMGSDTPTRMTAEELDELGDPLYKLFLKEHADEVRLSMVEEAIQPNASKRSLYAVSESIISSDPTGIRRAVISFEGFHNGEPLAGNAMLSVIFNSEDVHDSAFIEGWGWDESRGRYNYYRMDNGTWKFRGSSDNTELIGKADTCLACHLNGAPIMKELFVPWNHWESNSAPTPYLDHRKPDHWPIAAAPRLKTLKGAVLLERLVRSSIKNFNNSRIDSAIDHSTVSDAEGLLKHLFRTTEFNIISSKQESNMHPLSEHAPSQPSQDVVVPNSFFLNSAIIAGEGNSGFKGLGVSRAREFETIARVTPEEYRALVNSANLKVDGRAGDAHFAWLIPEPSDIDNDMIEKLMARFVVPAQFVAAALAIDMRNPLLSKRDSLQEFLPSQFEHDANGADGERFNITWFKNHDLTKQTIDALESSDISQNQHAMDFLNLLKMVNGKAPREELNDRVDLYFSELKKALEGADRSEALSRLFNLAIAQRLAVLQDPLLGSLDETQGKLLFPGQ